MKGQLVSVIVISLVASNVGAASFDCEKASTTIEKMVCASSTLSSLDERLGIEFKATKEAASDSRPLVNDQVRWLRQVRDACQDEKCLEDAYRLRISDLASWNVIDKRGAEIEGKYVTEFQTTFYDYDRDSHDPMLGKNCLRISPANNGLHKFEITVLAYNAHNCAYDGFLRKADDGVYALVQDKNDPNYTASCKLKVNVKNSTIQLEDPGFMCNRDAFGCGMGAEISGQEFLRSTKQPFSGSTPCDFGN